MHAAVIKHGILWRDLSARIVANGLVSQKAADAQVDRLFSKEGVTLPVAVALIDLILERRNV